MWIDLHQFYIINISGDTYIVAHKERFYLFFEFNFDILSVEKKFYIIIQSGVVIYKTFEIVDMRVNYFIC